VLHSGCVPETPYEMTALWDKVLSATAFEADNYWALKNVERPDGLKSDEIDVAVERQATRIANLTPLEMAKHG